MWTGPDSFNMSENVQASELERSLERTALLSNVVAGVNDGVYSCSAQIFPSAELESFITGESAVGSDTINIEILGMLFDLSNLTLKC
jgi:hypothetical protein